MCSDGWFTPHRSERKSTMKGTGMVCDMTRFEGMSSPEGSALQTKPSTAISRLGNDDDFIWAGAASLRATRASFSSRPRAL